MTRSDFTRWLYRGQRPDWIASILVTLVVTGRKLGWTISLPLVVAVLDGHRYPVSALRDHVQRVGDVRAAGIAILRSGGREEVQLEEVLADQSVGRLFSNLLLQGVE